MKGKIISRFLGVASSTTLVLILLAGSVIAGEGAPMPTTPTHSKISRPVRQTHSPTSARSNRPLTWFEMAGIALSSLGLL